LYPSLIIALVINKTFENCTFIANQALNGIAVYTTATTTFDQCLFQNNYALSQDSGTISVTGPVNIANSFFQCNTRNYNSAPSPAIPIAGATNITVSNSFIAPCR
jgi:hypothetical protein